MKGAHIIHFSANGTNELSVENRQMLTVRSSFCRSVDNYSVYCGRMADSIEVPFDGGLGGQKERNDVWGQIPLHKKRKL